MKKIALVLACLMAVPAMALTIDANDIGSGQVAIQYDATGDANQPRAFALVVSVDKGATIDAISGYPTDGTGFGIYPGTIAIDGTGTVTAYGSPVAPATDPGAAGTGLTTSSVVIELGSLYVGAANAPAEAGTLCILDINCQGASDVTVSVVEEDTYRGGVVLEDLSVPANVSDTVVVCSAPAECMKATAPEYATWVALGKPACWCYRRQCRGDIDGAIAGPFHVSIGDLNAFKLAFNKVVLPPNGECADFDHAQAGPFRVSIADLNTFKAYFNKMATFVPECDMTNYNFWTN